MFALLYLFWCFCLVQECILLIVCKLRMPLLGQFELRCAAALVELRCAAALVCRLEQAGGGLSRWCVAHVSGAVKLADGIP
jgi:hypothetical protein